MSLAPLPPVDGGSILKWTLVAKGRTEREADQVVRRIDWMLGSTAAIIGIGLTLREDMDIGLIFLGVGVIILTVTSGKIR